MADPFDGQMTPQQIANKRKMAQALLSQGMNTAPVGHWAEGLARGFQGALGGYMQGQADDGEKSRNSAMAQALQGYGTLNEGERSIIAQNPDIAQSVMTKTLTNKLDPNAGMSREKHAADIAMSKAQLQHLQQQGASEAQMAPLKKALLEAQVKTASQKDPEREYTSSMFQRLLDAQRSGGQQPQQQPMSGIQPQSFEGGQTGGDPMLIQTQAGGPPQPQQQQQPQQEMVEVPGLGRVPRRDAEAMQLAWSKDRGAVVGDAIKKTDLDKATLADVNKKEEAATDQLLRLRTIRSSYDPDFLQYGTQAKMKIAAVQAKMGKLDKTTEEKLYKFATFRRDTANNANTTIKLNSGATVTPQELERNQVELPNAGSGMFDGDDDVTFRAKVDRIEEVTALGIARMRYLREKGFTGPLDAAARQMPVERMRDTINARAKQIEGQVRQSNPGMAQPMIDRQVDLMVKKEFGI